MASLSLHRTARRTRVNRVVIAIAVIASSHQNAVIVIAGGIPMSVLNPATVRDLFDRLQAIDDVKAIAVAKGLDDAAFERFFAEDTASAQAQVAAALRVGPGELPKLVRRAADGKLFAFVAGPNGDSYAEVAPAEDADLGLDGRPIPGPAPVQESGAPAEDDIPPDADPDGPHELPPAGYDPPGGAQE
jgi:hypothetical protein